jgi:lipid-A-disaccharide synthase-like uncharacterized protein
VVRQSFHRLCFSGDTTVDLIGCLGHVFFIVAFTVQMYYLFAVGKHFYFAFSLLF